MLSSGPMTQFLFVLGTSALKKQLNMLANCGQKDRRSSKHAKVEIMLGLHSALHEWTTPNSPSGRPFTRLLGDSLQPAPAG